MVGLSGREGRHKSSNTSMGIETDKKMPRVCFRLRRAKNFKKRRSEEDQHPPVLVERPGGTAVSLPLAPPLTVLGAH